MPVPTTACNRTLHWFAGISAVLLGVLGCSGGDVYSVDEGRIAQRFLPSEQTVEYHPDSLGSLTITEKENKIAFELENDLESLIQKWSCTFRYMGTGRSQRPQTYATFWSLELTLATLQPEMGILTLQKERAQELIQERKNEYFNTIQIDVYWFIVNGGDGIISGPGARTQLRIADSTYQPAQESHGPLREAFVGGSGRALYRRNTFVFPRNVNGTDILKEATEMSLEVRRMGTGADERFTWIWEDGQTAQRRDDRSPRAQEVAALHSPRR